MQPRSLQQILSEIDSIYAPQIESVRQRQAAIPGQIQAEEQGLQAKQTQAFDDILGGARRRGLGFSGIPIGEQARYTSTEYLPALARLRQTGREQAMSLEDAILGIRERQNQYAQGIYSNEQNLAEQRRQFDTQLAAQQRAAAAQNQILSGVYGKQGQDSTPDVYANVNKQDATNAIRALLNTGNRDLINRTIAAITSSATRGNAYDKFKLDLLEMYKKNSQYGNLFKNLATTKAATSLPGATTSAFVAPGSNLLAAIGARR